MLMRLVANLEDHENIIKKYHAVIKERLFVIGQRSQNISKAAGVSVDFFNRILSANSCRFKFEP